MRPSSWPGGGTVPGVHRRWGPAVLVWLVAGCGGPLPIGDPPDGQDGPAPEVDIEPPDDGGGVDTRDDAIARDDAIPVDDAIARDDAPVDPCGGECLAHRYSACTCGWDDPCGWVGNGVCDRDACAGLTGSPFDDTADCGSPPACSGDCDAHRYSACSCGTDDPCGWAGNGVCDESACAAVYGADFDDGADCAPPGDLTYIVTSVAGDGLDASDMNEAASGFAGLGYAELARDGSTSWSDLVGYLGRDATVLYHTGHGNDGLVMTSDGFLSVDEVPGGIRVQNAIFATCLTLRVSWASAFASTAQSVLGYTEVSFDFVDNDVVRAMISSLGAGHSFIYAWYRANAGVSMLSDRWAGYVREGGSIVEYSARTGRTPSTEPLHARWVPLAAGAELWATAELLDDERTFAEHFVEVRTEGPGEWPAVVEEGDFRRLAATAMDAGDAADTAVDWLAAHGGLPEDARLSAVIPVERRAGETEPGVVVGYVVRFGREAAGLPVRGNLVEHHIAVLTGPEGVVSVSGFWPAVFVGEDPPEEPLLSVGAALEAAAEPLALAIKGIDLRVVGVEPVYGTRGPRDGTGPLTPAYAFRTTGGPAIIVEAATGRPLL